MIDYSKLAPVGIYSKFSWWDDIKDNFGEILKGFGLIAGGAGVAYLTKKVVPKQYSVVGYAGAGILAGIGAYNLYKGFTTPPAQDAEEGETYSISITSPSHEGEKWSAFLPHTISAQVSNNYEERKKVYMGMSMLSDQTGDWFDFPVKAIEINSKDMENVSWTFYGTPNGAWGTYWIVIAVWNIAPTPECTDCFRLGEANSSVWFGVIG